MRNKICFIIPYFGKFPNYFDLFLRSCSWNPEYSWLIFTDDTTIYNFPPNVIVHYFEFPAFVELIQNKFDFKISLKRPYKLCDFKPAYGYLFEEYLKNYNFWGYCDTDVIFGDLSQFLTDELLGKYDKLFCLGHMTIFKNTPDNNRVFMSKHHGKSLYKEVFQNDNNCWFDEEYKDTNNINQIFLQNKKCVFTKDISLNISNHHLLFRRTTYHGIQYYPESRGYNVEQYTPSIYIWKLGHLIRYRKLIDRIDSQDFPYIHLQSRKMRIEVPTTDIEAFQIIPNSFIRFNDTISLENFDRIQKGDDLKNISMLGFQRLYKKINNKIYSFFKRV